MCPAVLLKLFVVCAVEGLGSMRETLRRAERDLSIRRFLGYGLGERLPSHATVSYAQCVRFAQSSVFEQLFTQVLAACREAGLLDGRGWWWTPRTWRPTRRFRVCAASWPRPATPTPPSEAEPTAPAVAGVSAAAAVAAGGAAFGADAASRRVQRHRDLADRC